jgi:hypothetical protein
MGNSISLVIMIGVMLWNFYGIYQIGVMNATPIQWGLAGLMAVFVVRAIYQRR